MEQEMKLNPAPRKRIRDMSVEEKREYDKLHKRKSRAREKVQFAEVKAQAEKDSIFKSRASQGLSFFGEIRTGVDATGPELVRVLREWLRALEQPDIQKGETTGQLAKRCWDAWMKTGVGNLYDDSDKSLYFESIRLC